VYPKISIKTFKGKVIAKFLSAQQYTDCQHINTPDFTVN